MGRVLEISLSSEQESELQHYYKVSDNHVFRQRCQIVLLKNANRKSLDICKIVGLNSQNQVNSWVRRYKDNYNSVGINILYNAKGQGRKPIFDKETEVEVIEQVVKAECQKLDNAKLILEKKLNKSFNIKTLKNFLKTLIGDTNA